MVSNIRSLFVLMILTLCCTSNVTGAQAGKQSQKHGGATASAQGRQIFASTCAGCHGLDGRGSERAPNIAERADVRRLSDAQITHIIQNGVPGTGMPAFHTLQSEQVKAIVAHLRTLQGAQQTAKLPGDPARGKALFFGQAKCSSCHMVAGDGGFIASDLSEYGRVHVVEQIRDAITQPTAGSAGQVRLVTATLRAGGTFVGRVRNEDNFSIDLQSLDGAFHFISKSDLEKLEYDSKAMMPSDYGSTLSTNDVNDIISYLMSVAAAAPSKAAAKSRDWEE